MGDANRLHVGVGDRDTGSVSVTVSSSAAISRRKALDIADALRHAKERGRGAVLVIGAGCSVKGGIPTASGIIDEIRKNFPGASQRLPTKASYAECMAELSEGERRDLISRFVSNARINMANLAIAQLMKDGYVDRVFTTNFDPLITRACGLLGFSPAVYDLASSPRFVSHFAHRPAVIHLHGQHSGFILLNTKDRMAEHANLVREVFDATGTGQPWIIVGYSGENDPVFDELAKIPTFDYGAYWISHGENPTSLHVSERFLAPGKSTHLVGGFDADSFFVNVGQRLGCFPPAFLGLPFTHYKSLLDQLAPLRFSPRILDRPLPQGAFSFDLIDGVRDIVEDSARHYEEGRKPRLRDAHRSTATLRAAYFLFSGDNDSAIACRRKNSKNSDLDTIVSLALAAKAADRLARLKGQADKAAIEEIISLLKRARDLDNTNPYSKFVEGGVFYYQAIFVTPNNRIELLERAHRRFRASEEFMTEAHPLGLLFWLGCLRDLKTAKEAAGAQGDLNWITREIDEKARRLNAVVTAMEEAAPGSSSALMTLLKARPDDPRFAHLLADPVLSLRVE